MTATLPLAGLRVIEIGQYIAVPGATAILAALGADVVKIEPLGGEPARRIGPASAAVVDAHNRGKRSVAVDLEHPRGQELARTLAAEANAVVQNLRPGVLGRYGLDAATLRGTTPSLIHASVSGFGNDGPWSGRPGLDIAIQAESGMMSVTGEPDGPPQRVGFTVIDEAATHAVAAAVMAAMIRQLRTGEGEELHLSLLDLAVRLQAVRFMGYFATGVVPTRRGSGEPDLAPASDLIPTSDGHIVLSAYREPKWRQLCEAIGQPALADDPRFRDNHARARHRDDLLAVLADAIGNRTMDECVEWLGGQGIIVGAVRTYDQVLLSPGIAHSPLVGTDDDGSRFLRLPYRLAETTVPDGAPVPTVGQHTREVLVRLADLSDAQVAELVAAGVVAEAP